MRQKKLDKKKLEQYRKLLLKLKEHIEEDIQQMTTENSSSEKDGMGDVSGHAHIADVATDLYDREFHLGLTSNDKKLLSAVNKALKRMDDQSFGVCIECEKSIPALRLQALPYAETCLKCQEKIEAGRR